MSDSKLMARPLPADGVSMSDLIGFTGKREYEVVQAPSFTGTIVLIDDNGTTRHMMAQYWEIVK